jgi:hypothetical protein
MLESASMLLGSLPIRKKTFYIKSKGFFACDSIFCAFSLLLRAAVL